MHVTIVAVHVKPEHVDEFIRETEKNHKASIQETGNCRFDILQSDADPSKFALYEAYVDADAAARHKETAHYIAWRETVADWMAAPRQGMPFTGLFPKVTVDEPA
ncbi:MAG: antibiotic biosynthesis monooxygenase [Gammaproteobacteria bacterium]|nr:antibiotic biosynthesis monooxygenase [Gammaproteobacteria bacterium]MDH5693135.1 antibiotic biosynthesis monooxygenase [Gammaproteobacteria bacterium]